MRATIGKGLEGGASTRRPLTEPPPGLLLLLLLACSLLFWGRRAAAPVPDHEANGTTATTFVGEVAPIPNVTPSPFRNTTSEARYVGTERCEECHSDQLGNLC